MKSREEAAYRLRLAKGYIEEHAKRAMEIAIDAVKIAEGFISPK